MSVKVILAVACVTVLVLFILKRRSAVPTNKPQACARPNAPPTISSDLPACLQKMVVDAGCVPGSALHTWLGDPTTPEHQYMKGLPTMTAVKTSLEAKVADLRERPDPAKTVLCFRNDLE